MDNDASPDGVVRIYWHMDDCRLVSYSDDVGPHGEGSVDVRILQPLLASINQLAQHLGFEKVALQAHCNLEKYLVKSEVMHELAYYYHVDVYRYSTLTPGQDAVTEIYNSIYKNIQQDPFHALPVVLITSDHQLLQNVHALLMDSTLQGLPGTLLVVCTTLNPEDHPEVRALTEWRGALVYAWTPRLGVSQLHYGNTATTDDGISDQVTPLSLPEDTPYGCFNFE
ncbi:hypothetical protein BV898_13074 [Hypsibius exemplaris]|uniref:Uncharacterized protein n=1 Tax=Hypsibius exemplaris TaxID=2072580 RepID=A0A1W0WBS1_HYPEX|nr:hypothetical protein BV898_13074 [Hypsibius exemplaris]